MKKNLYLLLLLTVLIPTMVSAMVGAEPVLVNGEEITLLSITPTEKFIKADSSDRVYLVQDEIRYWLYNEALFNYYVGDDTVIEEIDGVDMKQYNDGRDIFLPVATLVKKIIGDRVYEVIASGELSWLRSPSIAKEKYGDNWTANIQIIPDKYFEKYTIVD